MVSNGQKSLSDSDIACAKDKFGSVSDEEWEFLSPHLSAVLRLIDGVDLDRIPDQRFRYMVVGHIAETSSDKYQEFMENYESKRSWKIYNTSL